MLFLFSFSGGDDSLDGMISLRGITVSKRAGIRTASFCSLRGYFHQNEGWRVSSAFCADETSCVSFLPCLPIILGFILVDVPAAPPAKGAAAVLLVFLFILSGLVLLADFTQG